MRRFLAKLLLLLLLLLIGQGLVAAVYPSEVPETILHFQALLQSELDILYFGDSTLWHPTGTQTTAEMLQELLPNQKVGELSHAAYSMDLYLSYVHYLLRQEHRPTLVIIPINMRSFSPEWNLRPGYQFTREKRVLEMGIPLTTLLGRPLQLFGGYDPSISMEEFLHSPVYNNDTLIGEVQDFEGSVGGSPLAEQAGEQFVYYQEIPEDADYQRLLTYYYLGRLKPEHRKVQAMIEIAQQLQAAGIGLLFYITPVNVELGDVYVGEAFRTQFSANVAVVKSQLTAAMGEIDPANRAATVDKEDKDVQLLDLSFDLAAYFFSDSEHLRQTGKQAIAEQLAAVIDPDAAQEPPNTPPASSTPILVATPTPPSVAPANPLLATAIARATQAAGSAITTTSGITLTVVPTPITNPLLATAVMRATEAAAP